MTPNTIAFRRLFAFLSLFFAFLLHGQSLSAKKSAPEVGKPLPPWSVGMLDLHQISTGRGNAAFYRFPDGTSMLVDAGSANDGIPMADTEPRPNATRSAGAWIVHYIERAMAPEPARLDYAVITHYHADHMGQVTPASKPSKSGTYTSTGITEVGASIPISHLLDRGTSYLAPTDAMVQNYRAFAAEEKSRGLVYAPLVPGSASQIKMLRDARTHAGFEVRNVVANGIVWTGEGEETRQLFPALETIPAEDKPTENMCSIGVRIRYGKFSYFTGGDMPGVPDAGAPEWQSVEAGVAKAIGPTTVHVVNHHGSIDPASAVFLAALRSPVMILPAWSVTHPSQDALKRMLATRLYPGVHDVYVTTLREPAGKSIGSRVEQLKAQHGHIVVRVEPGGARFRVFVLDDLQELAPVVSVTTYAFGPDGTWKPEG